MKQLDLKSNEAKKVINFFNYMLSTNITNITKIEVNRFPNNINGGNYDIYVNNKLYASGGIKLNNIKL